MAQTLNSLRVCALAAVNDHDSGVGGHQGPVGILGEVLVARGIKNIDAEACVLKLHDGRCDRNAALLFNFHPVGHGGPTVLLALDRARLGNGAAVQQKLFCQRRFAGVGVRDDRKGPAAADFLSQAHSGSSHRNTRRRGVSRALPEVYFTTNMPKTQAIPTASCQKKEKPPPNPGRGRKQRESPGENGSSPGNSNLQIRFAVLK